MYNDTICLYFPLKTNTDPAISLHLMTLNNIADPTTGPLTKVEDKLTFHDPILYFALSVTHTILEWIFLTGVN
jgi:hypothetical protein